MKKLFLLIIYIFVNSLLSVNNKLQAEIVNLNPSISSLTNIKQNKRLDKDSMRSPNFIILNNDESNSNRNQNLTNNLIRINSNQLYKRSLIEKKLIKNINKFGNSSTSERSSLQKKFSSPFNDISSTFLSPYGKHVPRAPDESLKACTTKECYE